MTKKIKYFSKDSVLANKLAGMLAVERIGNYEENPDPGETVTNDDWQSWLFNERNQPKSKETHKQVEERIERVRKRLKSLGFDIKD